MNITVQAIVLGTIRYGETSLIVSCYTKQFGLQTYILKGLLSAKKKKKISKSFFEPLTLIEFESKKNRDNKLGYLQELNLLNAYISIPFDLRKKAVVFFLAEVIHQIVKEEEQETNPGLFNYIKKKLLWLDKNDEIGIFHLKIMLDLTRFMGFYPNITDKDAPYFDLEAGSMSFRKPEDNYIDGALKTHWIDILGTKFELLTSLRLLKHEKAALLKHTISYFKLHLQQFKTPKSIEILNELFKVS
tara:strand:+ start:64 stop:798 length:735 start_codon:yes stop_codon:yes gene_type:complete